MKAGAALATVEKATRLVADAIRDIDAIAQIELDDEARDAARDEIKSRSSA